MEDEAPPALPDAAGPPTPGSSPARRRRRRRRGERRPSPEGVDAQGAGSVAPESDSSTLALDSVSPPPPPRSFGSRPPKPPRAPRPWVKNRDKVTLDESSYGARLPSEGEAPEPAPAPRLSRRASTSTAEVDYTPNELWKDTSGR